jgi:antirestriction protein ArdC
VVHVQQEYKKQDIYREVTDAIVASIENASSPELPWHRGGASHDRPRNASTGKHYSGVNVLTLWLTAEKKRYESDLWATYRQWEELGAQVQKGERGSPIIFYKKYESEKPSEASEVESRPRFYARTSKVFNADQVKGFSVPKPEARNLVEILQATEKFVAATNADIRAGGDRAYYNRSEDYIRMPERERFIGTSTSTPTESYYSTLLHELTHWSGHDKRLNRELTGRFGGQSYAMEELVAELGAAFLCADLKVANSLRPDHAAYIADWLEVLKNDTRAVFTASSKASEAAAYLAKLNGPALARECRSDASNDAPY